MEALPTFPGDVNGGSLAINDKGQAIGWSGACTTPLHALLWQDDSVMDLGSLGGEAPHLPFGINNRGQVVGFSSLPGDTTVHAFLWHDGVMTDLGTLPGDVASLADDINGEGQVVGTSFDAEGNPRAFLWHKGRMTDLNSLIRGGSSLVLLEASSINSRGDIAGYGFLPSTGEIHAFLARPKRQKFRREIDATTDEIGVAVLPAEVNRSHMDTLPEGVGRLLQQRLITAPFGGRAKRP